MSTDHDDDELIRRAEASRADLCPNPDMSELLSELAGALRAVSVRPVRGSVADQCRGKLVAQFPRLAEGSRLTR